MAEFDMVEALAKLQTMRKRGRPRGANKLKGWRKVKATGVRSGSTPKRVLPGQAATVAKQRERQRLQDARRGSWGKRKPSKHGRLYKHQGKYASENLKAPRRIDAFLVAFEPGGWFRVQDLAKRAQRASLPFPGYENGSRKPVDLTRLEKWWGLIERKPSRYVDSLGRRRRCGVYRLTPAGEQWRGWIIARFGIELMEQQKPPDAGSGG